MGILLNTNVPLLLRRHASSSALAPGMTLSII